MIIQLRGTSGSGKSTAVRRFMDLVGHWDGVYVPGRKRPLYYQDDGGLGLVVLGHYDSACGGCDTIGSARAVYDLLTENVLKRPDVRHVVCEGLLLSEDTKWSSQLPDLRVLYLTTPLERCLKQIEGRRAEAGNDKPVNPKNTGNRVTVIEKSRVKLIEAGVDCRRCSADQAPGLILKLLRLHAERRYR